MIRANICLVQSQSDCRIAHIGSRIGYIIIRIIILGIVDTKLPPADYLERLYL